MDSKLLVVKALMLVYWDSQLDTPVDGTTELVSQIVDGIRLPDNTLSMDHTRETLINLRGTIHNLITDGQEFPHNKQTLVQRLRLNIKDDDTLYNAVIDGLEGIHTQDEIKEICSRHRNDLLRYKSRKDIVEAIGGMSHQLRFKEDEVSWEEFPDELIAKLEAFQRQSSGKGRGLAGIRGYVGEVDFMDEGSVNDALETAVTETSLEGILQTGIQAINRMLGVHRGFRRGDTAIVAALSHCFKSGMMLKFFMGFAMHNKPFMHNLDKKPLLLLITLENSITDNIIMMYTTLMEMFTGRPCAIADIDIREAQKTIMDILAVNGYTVKMLRFDSGDFGYRQFFDLCSQLESEGYEIHAAGIDYAAMMSKEGCTQGATGADMRDLLRRLRSYTNPRGITLISPHQLNDGARELKRKHMPDFVKHVAGKGYMDSCRVLGQEVDIEIIVDRVVVGDEAFLELYIGKHRGLPKPTPEKDKYCVLKFFEIGGIVDDINGPDLSLRKVAGSGMSDEPAWDEPGGF